MPVFSKPDSIVNRNRTVFPEFNYLKRNLTLNNQQLAVHLRERSAYVGNGNLLAQLIYALPEPEQGEGEAAYYSKIEGISQGMLTAFGLVHDAGYGAATSDTVYTGISEYFIAVESTFNASDKDYGLTIISHPYGGTEIPQFTNVTLDERINEPKEYFAYFSINLAKFVLNYSRYVKQLRSQLKTGEEVSNPIERYLKEAVFPSLVSQHSDIAYFNGLTQLITGERLLRIKAMTDISLPKFDSKVADLTDDYFDYILTNMTHIEQFLAMELPSGRIMQDLMLEQPDKLQNTNWFYYLANHRMYSFMLLIFSVTGMGNSNDLISEFQYEIKDLKNFRSVLTHMDAYAKEEYAVKVKLLETYAKDA